MSTQSVIAALQAAGSPTKAEHLAYFFKTGKDQYGEGDRFLGVTVPEQRTIAKQYAQLDFHSLEELIRSPWHEVRLTALFILLLIFEKNKKDQQLRQACVDFYLTHTAGINNWDLVDLSCYKLLGSWLEDKDRSILYRLADSSNLWEQRISIVSCMHFVRKNDFYDSLSIADKLLFHPHDLIHKAVGWLLREVGKKDKQTLVSFLHPRYQKMPRTMLRYAIERFPDEERKAYLHGKITLQY